jgi:hypothetical protein
LARSSVAEAFGQSLFSWVVALLFAGARNRFTVLETGSTTAGQRAHR